MRSVCNINIGLCGGVVRVKVKESIALLGAQCRYGNLWLSINIIIDIYICCNKLLIRFFYC